MNNTITFVIVIEMSIKPIHHKTNEIQGTSDRCNNLH